MALVEARVPEPFEAAISTLAATSGESKSEVVRRLLLRGLREMAVPGEDHRDGRRD